jgi:predicted aspartyl protease
VDLTKLVGGIALTLPCIISNNRLRIQTQTLIDTGANGFIFINPELAKKAAYFFDIPI